MKKNREERTSIAQRFFTSLIFTSSILITTSLIPFIISMKGRGHSGNFKLYHFYTSNMYITLLILSVLFGFFYHPNKVYMLLGHLWNTEKPKNQNLTISLWLIILSIGGLSYYIQVY